MVLVTKRVPSGSCASALSIGLEDVAARALARLLFGLVARAISIPKTLSSSPWRNSRCSIRPSALRRTYLRLLSEEAMATGAQLFCTQFPRAGVKMILPS